MQFMAKTAQISCKIHIFAVVNNVYLHKMNEYKYGNP